MNRTKAVIFAIFLFHIVSFTLRYFHPVLRPWIVTSFKYLYRYVLLPYSTFWLDHFYILWGVVASFMFYYIIRVLPSPERMNPFAEMRGCGECEWCREGRTSNCALDPGNSSRQNTQSLQASSPSSRCTPCLLTHYVREFCGKLTRQNVDDLRERLHEKGVLDQSDMDELHEHLTSNMTNQVSLMFSKLSKKKNGYDAIIEVLLDLDEAENHNAWFGDLAKELMVRFCRECQKRYPKGYPTLIGLEFFETKTFSTSLTSEPTVDASSTITRMEWKEHGIKISFPKCSTQTEVTVGVILNGHFKLPSGAELVSPVYNITTAGILNKSIYVELKHCAILNNSTDESLLNFVKVELPSNTNHDGNAHSVTHKYKMHYYTHPETCFSRYGFQSGSTVIPPSDTPIRSFLLAIVKMKRKWYKIFSKDLQCLYRLQVFYNRPRSSDDPHEWEANVVATRELPSYQEILKKEFPSDSFSSGASTVTCLGASELSVELPKIGAVTTNGWRVTPTTKNKVTRHQMDYPSVSQLSGDSTLISSFITLKLRWLGGSPASSHQTDSELEQSQQTPMEDQQWASPAIPELDYALVIKGTAAPYPCDILPLHFEPEFEPTSVEELGSSSSATFGEIPSDKFDESTKSKTEYIHSLAVLKANVWKILSIFKIRFRIFVSLPVEVSVLGTYIHAPNVPDFRERQRRPIIF